MCEKPIVTYYTGDVDYNFVKEWFGCDQPDVEWYRIEEEQIMNNDNCKDFIWLYNFVTHLDLISHQLPIKVNGKKVVNAKLTDDFEIELITEE